MAARFGRFISIGLVSVVASSCDLLTGPEDEFRAAQRAIDAWVRSHPTVWEVSTQTGTALARASYSEPCHQNPPSQFVTLEYNSRGVNLTAFFRCPVDASADVTRLNASFSHLAIYELPHGIESDNWRFEVLTPSSSFSDSVAFSTGGSGRLRISIDTPLFAVRGHSTRRECEPPADAPSPEGCYYSREHRIPLRLTALAPFNATVFD